MSIDELKMRSAFWAVTRLFSFFCKKQKASYARCSKLSNSLETMPRQSSHPCGTRTGNKGEVTYRANSFCHFRDDHDDGEAPATEGCDGEFVIYVAELGLGVEDAHVEELGEDLALHAGAEWVLCREEGEAVG